MIDELNMEILDILAADLPQYPPLKPGGDVTIKEMLPDLSDEELDYIMTKYTGTMEKG